MPPYTAQRQPLFGVGTPGYVRPAVDVGGAIDAIAGSANSLVQQAYTRGMQQREQALREQEFGLQQQREARESAAQQRQLDIAEEGNRIRKLQAGVTPAHDEMSMETPAPTIPSPTIPSRSPSKVATAMISGLPSQEGNSPLTRPVDLGTSGQPQLVTRHVDEAYDPTQSATYVRSVGMAAARHQNRLEEIDESGKQRAANRAPRWVTKVDEKGNYFRENQDTGDVDPLQHPDGSPIKAPPRAQGRSSGGESPDVASSRKDLADTGRQQVRAENQVKALKSEQRQIQRDNPRAARPMNAQRTAADSAVAQQYQDLGTQVGSAQQRANALTQRADSISGEIDKKRRGGGAAAPAASTGASPPGDIDPDSITDSELIAAHAAGARTNADVKTFVAKARISTGKPKRK